MAPKPTRQFWVLFLSACIVVPGTHAQLLAFSKQELIDYTSQSPYERFADGRPKVPDDMIERARDVSSEEVWASLLQKGFKGQFADGFQIVHGGKNLVGRAFTVQFMPLRTDVDDVAQAKAKARIQHLMKQTAIDMLQPGDVLVVDLFGKKVNGTIVGDNLFYYIANAVHCGGLVVDGSIRDLDGISQIDMPAYFRQNGETYASAFVRVFSANFCCARTLTQGRRQTTVIERIWRRPCFLLTIPSRKFTL